MGDQRAWFPLNARVWCWCLSLAVTAGLDEQCYAPGAVLERWKPEWDDFHACASLDLYMLDGMLIVIAYRIAECARSPCGYVFLFDWIALDSCRSSIFCSGTSALCFPIRALSWSWPLFFALYRTFGHTPIMGLRLGIWRSRMSQLMAWLRCCWKMLVMSRRERSLLVLELSGARLRTGQ
jgi:hypothetical protein